MLTPRECGIRCRVALGNILKSQYGAYRLKGRKLLFKDTKIFTVYTDFHPEISQWFYGVPEIEWGDWKNQYLAAIMKESNKAYYVLIPSDETALLFSKCGKDYKGNKKINIRRPTSGGKIYFVEWQEFPLPRRLLFLPVSFD